MAKPGSAYFRAVNNPDGRAVEERGKPQQVGYRGMPLALAAVTAAIDVSAIVPALAPASVCYVLGETMLRLAGIPEGNGDQAIMAYLKAIADAKSDVGDRLPVASTNSMRVPLLYLVGEALRGREISSETFRTRTGIDGALQLSSAEFSMWIFRDLQARRLAEELR